MKMYEAIARSLSEHDVDTVFGVLGEANMLIVDTMVRDHGTRYVAAKREDAAISMADGYARVTGKVGVATVTHGPALTNTVTALTEAGRSRTPLVLLAGDTPEEDRRNPQDIDQIAVVRPTGAAIQNVRSAATVTEDVVLAFRRAVTDLRPVLLNVRVQFEDEDV